MMSDISFRPYVYNFIDENEEKYALSLIALYKGNNVIKLTDYHKYIGDKSKTKHFYYQNQDEVRRICNFLTYVLIDNFFKYKTKSISEIPFEAVQNYITSYASKKTQFDEFPSAQSVTKERNAVCMFMYNLKKFRKDKTHYYARKVKSNVVNFANTPVTSKRKEYAVWEYEIPVNYLSKHKYKLVRDIPQEAIGYLLKWINLRAPELYFAVILQLCAGLREGEIVNVRQADSKYPGGIKYSKENGKMTSFEIDLKHNYFLRSDGVNTGDIKIERSQSVYTPFLPVVQKAYEQHLKMMRLKKLELTKPMFVNNSIKVSTGCNMAITKRSYCDTIIRIIERDVIPELLKSENIELRTFAASVTEGSWGLHAFRHWFTVQLVLNGEDANSIAFWRGDSSTKTAFEYLQNKGILMKKYMRVTDKVSDDLISVILEMERIDDGKNKFE